MIPAFHLQTTCPYCARLNELHSGTGDETPEPDDWSMCWVCRRVAVFMQTPEGLVLRRATRVEQEQIEADPQCVSARQKALTYESLPDALRAWRARWRHGSDLH